MHIFGGGMAGGPLNDDLWKYALGTRAWTQVVSAGGSAPSPRHGHSLGNRLVVFGGGTRNSFDSSLYCFDLQRRRWSDLAVGGEPPCARANHAAISCGDGVLVFGGSGPFIDIQGTLKICKDTFLLRVWP